MKVKTISKFSDIVIIPNVNPKIFIASHIPHIAKFIFDKSENDI